MLRVAFAAGCVATLVTVLAASASAAPPPAGTTVEASATVPSNMDGCLDHSVKELGMSAKKAETERRWEIHSRYLHSAVATDGTLGVRMERGDKGTAVKVLAMWPGAPKDKDTQGEIESRLRAMTEKMAQLCGVARPEVVCAVTAPGGKPAACAPVPKS